MKKTTCNNQKGFTLIELMIVIAIIGILAAIAIPNYISYRDKAYCSGAESDASAILNTLADYYAIPTHTGAIVGNVGPTATTLTGVAFKALSNKNTAVLANVAASGVQEQVVVTDVSKRCPTAYMNAQSDAGWDDTASTFTKSM